MNARVACACCLLLFNTVVFWMILDASAGPQSAAACPLIAVCLWKLMSAVGGIVSCTEFTGSWSKSSVLVLYAVRAAFVIAMFQCCCPRGSPDPRGPIYKSLSLSSSHKARFPLPELTARVDRWPVSITRQHGPSTRLVETRARQHGPCWRVMETGHPSTRAVNSGRQLG